MLLALHRASARTYCTPTAAPKGFQSLTGRFFSRKASKFDAEYLRKNMANYTQLSPVSQLKKTVHRIQMSHVMYIEAHFAVPSTGAILHSLNTRSDAKTIAFQLEHAETKFLLVDTEHTAVVRSALSMMGNSHSISIIQIHDDPLYPLSESFHLSRDYEELLSTGDPTGLLSLPDDEWDAISLNYTSGTTGNPKGVVSHHRGAYLNSLSNVVEWNMPLHPRFLWIVPMFHCNGWCFPWTMAATAGTSYFLRSIRASSIFDIINKYQIQYLAGAPVTMNTMLAHNEKIKFTHSIQMWAAGAPPPTSVIKRFSDEIGIKVQCAYGLTETYGPICTHNVDRDWVFDKSLIEEEKAISSGGKSNHSGEWLPHTDQELLLKSTFLSCDTTVEDLKILDPLTMLEVPADGVTVGEVMVRGNVVMKGYLGNEAATRAAFEGGWFHTGDLAVHHGNGRIEIKDRSKDIIISGGENISSIAVEAILVTHPMVDEAAVIAFPDEKWGEVPLAFVTLRHDVSVPPTDQEEWRSRFASELSVWARKNMAGYQTPRSIRLVDSLPKTITGKVQKNILRDMSKTNIESQ